MIYNSEPGRIYDTIFFFIEYFNEKEIDKDYIKIYEDTRFMVECFERVKSEAGKIPKLLSPFFCIADDRTSPVSSFFSRQIDFRIDTIDSFILKLSTNVNSLYQNTVDNIFNHYAKGEDRKLMPAIDPADYVEAINDLDLPLDFKFQASLLLGNFNYAVSVLAVSMKKIYELVRKLHSEHKREITMEFEQIQSKTNARLYDSALQYGSEVLGNAVISISLLNQYYIYRHTYSDSNAILFGYKHEEKLKDKFDKAKATAENFLITCGSDVRVKIIKALIENGEMTTSQIAKYIDSPVTTLIRHISLLQENGIIYVSNRDRLQIFYRLNKPILRKVKVSIDDLFSNILNGKGVHDERENEPGQ